MADTDTAPETLTLADTARALGLSRTRTLELVESGRLTIATRPAHWLIVADDRLDAEVAAREGRR